MNLELLLEAERRGILPPDKAGLLAEARKRGLVPDAPQAVAEEPVGVWDRVKGAAQTARENIIGDDDPTTQNTGEKIGSFINKAIESATFGLVGDEAQGVAAAVIPGGKGYAEARDAAREQERLFEQSNPGAALTADITGAVGGALSPMGAIGTLQRGARLLPRIGASTAAGAGMGATYGAMEGEGLEDRLQQAQTGGGIGAVVGALAPAVGAGAQKVADMRTQSSALRRAAANAPTTEQLRAQGQALYGDVERAGVSIRPDVVRNKMDNIVQALRAEGAGYTGAEKVLPASRAVMEAAGDVGSQSNTVPFREMDIFRRYVGSAAGKDLANKADTRAVTQAATGLDDFIQGLQQSDVDAGDVQALQTALPKAKDVWARMSRSQLVDDAMENAADYRTGEASGLRAQFQRIVKNPNLRRGFSDAELKVMRRVVNGTLPEQILGYLGSGLGMMGQMGVGAVLGGGLPGAIAGMATGALSRKGAEASVRRNAEIARAIIANGGLQSLPVASDAARKITEALLRRSAAAGPQ